MTLHELQTIYGLEDAYDLIEVGSVNAHNALLAKKREEERLRNLANANGH